MKRLFVALAVIGMLTSCSDSGTGDRKPTVRGFADPAGQYTVAFHGTPEATVNTAPMPDGSSLELTTYSASVGSTLESSLCVDFSEQAANGGTLSLEGARDGALENTGMVLLESESIRLQGREGIAFRGSGPRGQAWSRIFVDGDSLCTVMFISGLGTDLSSEGTEFLDSFSFTEATA